MPSLEYRNVVTGEVVTCPFGRNPPKGKDWKKVACVFKEDNGKWAGFSLPFPSLEAIGYDENADGGIYATKEEAEKALVGEDYILISEDEVKSYL